MISKLPIISSSLTLKDLMCGLGRMRDARAVREFRDILTGFTGSRHLYLSNSGISSFYIILKALGKLSERKEVVLPAYTAGSLVVAVRKAGLKPVLCDISLADFNLDENLLSGIMSPDTLAVVAVHMFGVNMKGIAQLKAKMPDGIFLIEDCCQSMGSRTEGKGCGSFGDVGFFSFNRGKNLPLYGGGAIVTNDEKIAVKIEEEMRMLGGESWPAKILTPFKILAFILSGNPLIYGLCFPLISRFKETAPPKDFPVKRMDRLHARLGLLLMKRIAEIFSQRRNNGISLVNALNGLDGIILPEIPGNAVCVFNRLPVLFKDIDAGMSAEKRLWEGGIESSRMYRLPLHQMFDMGYAAEDFPNAVYCAERLLTLPTHPGVKKTDIDKMIGIIKGVLG